MALSDIALVRDANSGGMNFKWSKGDVVFDTTQEHEVMSRLVEKRGQWWADETGTHGSRIFTIKQVSVSLQSDADAYAREALKPMTDRKAIVVKDVIVQLITRARPIIQVYWQNVDGGPVKVAKVHV